ncbi:MAG: BrnT family toxin [Pseudomonadota bacterium]
MRFEWDEEKDAGNFAKHGVRFELAAEVFLDPYRLETVDDRFDYAEERIAVIGMVSLDVLFVVATERDADLIRLISARRATKAEERRYFLSRAER